jgi:hypothetical protein
MMISEFREWLRLRTNRHGRPFQAETISAYYDAAHALDAWMTRTGLEVDFTGCDTTVLNRIFRDYLAEHCQNGTNTKAAQPAAPGLVRVAEPSAAPARPARSRSAPGCPLGYHGDGAQRPAVSR